MNFLAEKGKIWRISIAKGNKPTEKGPGGKRKEGDDRWNKDSIVSR